MYGTPVSDEKRGEEKRMRRSEITADDMVGYVWLGDGKKEKTDKGCASYERGITRPPGMEAWDLKNIKEERPSVTEERRKE